MEKSINNVTQDEILVIRKSYIDICNKDKNAAILLAFFLREYESRKQVFSISELKSRSLGLLSRRGVSSGRQTLRDLGFLTEEKNKHSVLNDIYFLLNLDKINDALEKLNRG